MNTIPFYGVVLDNSADDGIDFFICCSNKAILSKTLYGSAMPSWLGRGGIAVFL